MLKIFLLIGTKPRYYGIGAFVINGVRVPSSVHGFTLKKVGKLTPVTRFLFQKFFNRFLQYR